MKKILLVEDDLYLQKSIKELLLNHSFEVLSASNKAEAIYYVINYKDIDLYLLDIWLPDGEGFDLCKEIRKRYMTPIIFLTACDDEASVVKGLNMGGDDYIIKPFRAAELISRIQANLRRQNVVSQSNVYVCGELKFDKEKRVVYKGGNQPILRPIEYQLLRILIANPGVIIRREQLLEELWDESGNFVEDNTLSVHMSRLRSRIGNEYIETIRGFGYRFVSKVRTVVE